MHGAIAEIAANSLAIRMVGNSEVRHLALTRPVPKLSEVLKQHRRECSEETALDRFYVVLKRMATTAPGVLLLHPPSSAGSRVLWPASEVVRQRHRDAP